jgi:hypothetical protein
MIKTTCLGCGKPVEQCVCHSPDNWQTITGESCHIGNTYPYSCKTTTLPYNESITGDIEESDAELIEQLNSMRNRIDAVLWLLENPNAFYVLHTLLEDIYEAAEIILEDFCVEGND